jgi:Rps23 Pro-64 3,4-dihydroxylase Tpa1-like proline 4-hydroxylase
MSTLSNILQNYQDISNYRTIFENNKPIKLLSIDDFLKQDLAVRLYKETFTVKDEHWTTFTRKGSHMKECKKLTHAPYAFNLVSYFHSSEFLQWLTSITGINGLIPDPHLVGAGYSKSFKGDTLQVHTDFNWNEQLKLHRALSLIIYLTPNWKEEWGGALDFYNSDKTSVENTVSCMFNRLLIWKYHRHGFHGYETPLSCPENLYRSTFRLFYYTSNSSHLNNDLPHRSLYWYDTQTNQPYDIRTEK